MLLPGLIDQEYLASGVSVAQVDERARDGRKKEHVHEDEDDIVDVVGLVILNGEDLVVRIRVVSSCDIDQEDHLLQVSIVRFVSIERVWIKRILISWVKGEGIASDKRIPDYDDRKEDEVDQHVLVGRCQ